MKEADKMQMLFQGTRVKRGDALGTIVHPRGAIFADGGRVCVRFGNSSSWEVVSMNDLALVDDGETETIH